MPRLDGVDIDRPGVQTADERDGRGNRMVDIEVTAEGIRQKQEWKGLAAKHGCTGERERAAVGIVSEESRVAARATAWIARGRAKLAGAWADFRT